jgi:hypothetical protein
MPASYNKIGTCQMLSVEGFPDEPGLALTAIEHEGVDGTAFRQRGTRSAPFTLRSTVDEASGATAKATFAGYKALQGRDPVSVFDEFGNEWVYVVILGVRLAAMQPIATPVGGLVAANAATVLLIAEWLCQSVNQEFFG